MLLFIGCNNDDNGGDLSLEIINFQTSNNQVTLNWKLNKPDDIIIQDLQILRNEKNDGEVDMFSQPVIIANLPSNETNFVDNNVPYKSEVTYIVKINYTKYQNTQNQVFTFESVAQLYIRNIVLFETVPFQVQRDPIDINSYHILDKTGTGNLKKYNFIQNELSASKSFTNGWLLNNRFHIYNNEIFIADTEGKIVKLNAQNYQTLATYNTVINDDLNAFAIDGDRIYYQDDNIWKYYTISSGTSINCNIATQTDYVETLSNNRFLFLYAQQGSNSLDIKGFSPQNCNAVNCFPDYFIYPTGNPAITNNKIDPNIFVWNPTKQKFITSYEGCVFNLSTLQAEIKLKTITNKHYFQFAYDNQGNIYGAVQGEKKIHKFDSNYQLIEIINTKLYPLFPMISNNELKVIGSYEPISYWGYYYGYEFNFNNKCAIEIF